MIFFTTIKREERRNLPQKKNKEGRRTQWRTKQREKEKEEDQSKKNYIVLYKHTMAFDQERFLSEIFGLLNIDFDQGKGERSGLQSQIRDFKIVKDRADISYYAGYVGSSFKLRRTLTSNLSNNNFMCFK
ncbi:hypothetical protein P8452_02713 [Trifolium repens]|nr:hypothetical protein P8452_02713 [Trifolium repens]